MEPSTLQTCAHHPGAGSVCGEVGGLVRAVGFPVIPHKLLRCLSAPFTNLPSRGRACLATKAFFPHLGAGGCCAITSGCWLGAGVGQEKPSPAGLQPPGPHIEGKKSEVEVGKSIWLRSRGESPLATSLCLLKCDHLSDLAPPTMSLPPPHIAIPSPTQVPKMPCL